MAINYQKSVETSLMICKEAIQTEDKLLAWEQLELARSLNNIHIEPKDEISWLKNICLITNMHKDYQEKFEN